MTGPIYPNVAQSIIGFVQMKDYAPFQGEMIPTFKQPACITIVLLKRIGNVFKVIDVAHVPLIHMNLACKSLCHCVYLYTTSFYLSGYRQGDFSVDCPGPCCPMESSTLSSLGFMEAP